MQYFQQTLSCCRTFLEESDYVADAFENLSCSSCPGFEFTLTDGWSGKLRVDESIGYVIFELFPGVQTRAPWLDLVAEYCLQALPFPSPTYFAVDPEQGVLFHHSEQSFRAAAVSDDRLHAMLDRARAEIRDHLEIFRSLAGGHFPDPAELCRLEAAKRSQKPPFRLNAQEEAFLESSLEALADFLHDCGHNTVGTRLSFDGSPCFYTEILLRDARYRCYYHVREGYLLQAARMDLRPDPAFRGQLASFANAVTSEKKVAHMTLGPDGFPYVVTSQYLLEEEGALDTETAEEMERIVISFFRGAEEGLRAVCAGRYTGRPGSGERESDEDEEEDIPVTLPDDFPFDDAFEPDEEELPFPPRRPTGDRIRQMEQELDALLSRVSAGEEEEDTPLPPRVPGETLFDRILQESCPILPEDEDPEDIGVF